MGWDGFPAYGEDLGSAIEKSEKILAVLKTNKFDDEDLIKYKDSLEEVCDAIAKKVNED
jgi:hypothetical protein